MGVVGVILFVSLGLSFFFGLCLFSFYWFVIKVTKNKSDQVVEIIRGDEHFKAKEDIAKGPSGTQAVAITIEDDIRFEGGKIHKEKKEKATAFAGGKAREINTVDLEGGASSSNN